MDEESVLKYATNEAGKRPIAKGVLSPPTGAVEDGQMRGIRNG